MSVLPYRIPSPPEKVGAGRSKELVYTPSEEPNARSASRGLTKIALAGALVAWVAASSVGPVSAVVVIVATLTVMMLRVPIGAPKPPRDAVRFLVDGRLLTITQHDRVLFCGPLDAITNVTLDTKSITKVRVDNALDVAVQGTSAVRPEVDIARILVVAGSVIYLSDGYVAHMDAIEGVGRIRSFLRAHDWKPEDERDDPSDPA